MSYVPGRALIFSRIPAQSWFTLDEAAEASGWSRSYMRDRIQDSTLPAQEFQKKESARAKGKGPHKTYKIHVDDLVLFIIRNGNGRFSEEKPFRDVSMIVDTWPRWMREEFQKFLASSLTTFPAPPVAGSHDKGTVAMAQETGKAAAPGGAAATSSAR